MKKEKSKIRLDGALGNYLRWPLYLSVILICFDVILFLLVPEVALYALIYTVIYILVCCILFVFKRNTVQQEIIDFAVEYNVAQSMMIKDLDVPFALLNLDGSIVWASNDLKDLLGTEKYYGIQVSKLFDSDELGVMPSVEEDQTVHINYGNRSFRVKLRLLTPSEYGEAMLWREESGEYDAPADALIGMFMYDETENIALKKENFDERMLVGLLYIDNFEEAFENSDEVKKSIVTAWIEREVNKYLREYDAVLKRLEKDKYIFVFKQKYLAALEGNRFSILESIRNLSMYDLKMTISIGIGVYPDSYVKCYELAHAAIDMALGRGGDQAIVKHPDKIAYYGGTTASQEKQTRVKARVKAQALREYIENKDTVVIMGHQLADIDAVGSAIGIYCVARAMGKKAHISLSKTISSVAPFVQQFISNPDYPEDMFITGAQAKEKVNNDTLLVVVDVNRPSYTDEPALLELTKTIVVLDHHRQTNEVIENAVLSYIEPYASSACEMIAEIMQYIGAEHKFTNAEADAMYAGIMIDTNNFLTKTGVRTFEAAAYLRRCGADVTRVRKLCRTNMNEYQAKATATSNAEIFMDYYVFAESESEGVESPTVIAAQVANELLDIDGTKASFVFTEYNDRIYVSARSIDELNVQVVMEKLGGGGHMSVAGCQFTNMTIPDAMNKVKKVLIEMAENNELK